MFRALQLPSSPLKSPKPEPSVGPAVPRGTSSELPAWFGDRIAAPRRIAGKVLGARSGMTVRLAIDVPDPGIWSGREVAAAPDGSFDFGVLPIGNYLVVAFAGTDTSPLTHIDTTCGASDHVTLSVFPCPRFADALRQITFEPRAGGGDRSATVPAVGVRIEIAGRVLGTTDASGHYDVCVHSIDDLKLIAPGYESVSWFPRELPLYTNKPRGVLLPAYTSSGTVFDVDGSPAQHVGVQPVWRMWSDAPPYLCFDADVVVTTDAEGHFTYYGRHEICGIRVFRGTTIYETTYPFTDAQLGPLPAGPSITPLASLHDEQLIVRLPGGGREDFERIGARSLARP